MTTNSPAQIPMAAPRGAVQKIFVPAEILAGFTDPGHFNILAGEYLATILDRERIDILGKAQAARDYAKTLPPFANGPAVLRELANSHIDAIRADPLFAQSFGRLPHKFAYVDLRELVALQAWVEPRFDPVPKDEDSLLELALPRTWDVPAEVSLIPPTGPIQILSSNPAMQGLAVELDPTSGKVMLSAPKHINLVQVVQFNGRYYLRNGYHRATDALRSGLNELPAIVIDAFTPDQVAVPGHGTFNFGYMLNQSRPPLVRDFHTGASITARLRERRYGMIVNLDVKPINIGI